MSTFLFSPGPTEEPLSAERMKSRSRSCAIFYTNVWFPVESGLPMHVGVGGEAPLDLSFSLTIGIYEQMYHYARI